MKLTFNDLPEKLYNAINIDKSKAVSYKELIKQEKNTHVKSVVLALHKGQELEACKFEEYV